MNTIQHPLVSVMIPYYNCEQYIAETIASVEAQHYPHIEIIIVDDGSSAESAAFLARLLKSKPAIRLATQNNQGVAATRNHAARLAKGEYFLFLDADDQILPDYIQKSVEILESRPNCKLVYAMAEFFDAKEGLWQLPPYEGIKSLLTGNRFPSSVSMHRAADFKALGGFDESFATHEDWDFWIRLLSGGDDVYQIPEVLFRYRKRRDGSSLIDKLEQNTDLIREDWQRIYEKHHNLFLQHHLGYWDHVQTLQQADSLQQQLAGLHQKLSTLQQKSTNLYQQLDDLQQEKRKLEQTIAELSNQNTTLSQRIQHEVQHFTKYKGLWTVKAFKPIIKTEQAISSANRYRKAFRKLTNEKVSIGKAYQHLRYMYKTHDLRTVKLFLRTGASVTLKNNNKDSFDITDRLTYQEWIKQNDTRTPQQLDDMRRQMAAFSHRPKISVLMPVYNVDVKWLKMAIDSVRGQLYENWELCIADDASPNADIRPLLEQYAASDERIKVVFREKNGHISENSNSALALCSGEWTALMDHDDLLPEHALFEVVKVLQTHPDAALIYSDEDKVDESGMRFMPHFKSDFNPDLLYGQNYVSHLGVYRTDIAKAIGGFRKGLEGSQDYDFLLRYLLKVDQSKVVHIPKILYHWRAIEGSTALASGEKSYTTEAGIKALQHHFSELGSDVTVTRGKADNLYRVKWHHQETPLVSLIMPTRNGYAITKQAIDSILEKTTYSNYEILLVDNNSDDPQALAYFDEIAQHEKVTLLRYPHLFNYSAINNFAARHAKGSIIGLINNDIEVINGEWLEEMVSQAQRPDIGCVGAMLYYPNDTVQHAGVIIGIGSVAGHAHKYFARNHHGYYSRLQLVQNLMAVTAACLLVRKAVFDEVGGLNEQDLTVAFNDVDFCLKVHTAGYRNLWTPYAELYHHESISRGHEDNPEKRARFQREIAYMIRTWQTDTLQDPYYNPNLTLQHEDFSIAMKSRVKR